MRDKVKQKRYIKERAKGKSIRKAAKAADVPFATAARAESDPAIKSAMTRALESVGCTDKKIATTVLEALDANKTVSAVSGKDAGAGSVDFVDVPDFPSRLKAAELAGKFRGDFVEKHQVDQNVTVSVIDYSKAIKEPHEKS
jgi:hypothetical protein